MSSEISAVSIDPSCLGLTVDMPISTARPGWQSAGRHLTGTSAAP